MTMAPFELTGRRALVTGSSRGIGASIAKGLARFGAAVALHGIRPGATDVSQEAIEAAGGKAAGFHGDLGEVGAGRALIHQVEDRFGPLDILVVNASAQVNTPFEQFADADYQRLVDVNLRSTFEMLQTVPPSMAGRGWGRVVNIGSVNQNRPKSIVSIYAATKAAQHNLIVGLARDYAKKGVLLNTLAPGMVDTDRNAARRDADPQAWAAYLDSINWMGRAAQPDEMVGAAVFLASDACSFMTGETLYATGGV